MAGKHMVVEKPVRKGGEEEESGSISNTNESGSITADTTETTEPKKLEKSKADIEMLILKNGGKVTANATSNTDYVIASPVEPSFQTKNLLKSKTYDVLYAQWVIDCVEGGGAFAPKAEHFLVMKESTKEALGVDEYGDSYTDPCTVQSLRRLLPRIPETVWCACEAGFHGSMGVLVLFSFLTCLYSL